VWVRFTAPFEWSPLRWGGRLTRVFKVDQVRNVPTVCGQMAIDAGKAERCAPPPRTAASEEPPADG
jgi:hypothetical protein